jgi:hypothetical protein
MAAGPDHARIGERGQEAREPAIVRDGVVVDEHDVLTTTPGDRRVAGGREPARIRIGDDLHRLRKARAKIAQECVVVVHYDDDLGGPRFLAEHRADTRDCLLESRGRERADHHRGVRRGGSRARIHAVSMCVQLTAGS